jgi:enamine deaminase RidA (YjgF/YER057c/UK114 family)
MVTNGLDRTIGASGTLQLSYVCTYPASGPTSYIGINTATATWASGAGTPTTSVSGTAGFTFGTGSAGNPTNTTQTVKVTDKFDTLAAAQIHTLTTSTTDTSTVTGTTAPPYASKTWVYTRNVAVPASGCKSYLNTATIHETGQFDTWTVRVCGPLNTGGKTIGFWQNKNGQNIIKNAGAVSTVCKVTPFLRNYNPFKDLGATATCAKLATYVTNVIKAANSSGASMNAMLKAQMLATALDVYFSDSALGGNKIGAPVPIGGLVIDLTRVWGNQNVSAAFGGATSLSVSQMLSYAASQSNNGGSAWYGQSKTLQGLAKNAFDAINNSVVFAP